MSWLIESPRGHRCDLPDTRTDAHAAGLERARAVNERVQAEFRAATAAWEAAGSPRRGEPRWDYSKRTDHACTEACVAYNAGSMWQCDDCGTTYELGDNGRAWSRVTLIPRPRAAGTARRAATTGGDSLVAGVVGFVLGASL